MDEMQQIVEGKIDIFSLQTQSTSNQSVNNESMSIEMKQVQLDNFNFEIENESNEVTVVYESILHRKKFDAGTTEYSGFRPKIRVSVHGVKSLGGHFAC